MGIFQNDPQPAPDKILPERLTEDAYIRLKKLEYDYTLARVGLTGTLWGAWAILVTILVVVLVPVFSPSAKSIVSGSEVVWMVVAFVVPVVFYGSFIFGVALFLSAKLGKHEIGVQGSPREASKEAAKAE